MDCAAVVPCRTGEHIEKVVSRLKAQGAFVTVVRDRCDADCHWADAILDNRDGDGFMAGKCRDIGVDYVLSLGADCIIFVDEDCIPQDELVSSHIDYLRRGIPAISLGRRLEQKHGWRDPRELGDAGNMRLFNPHGSIVQNPSVLQAALVTWTCNLGINRAAAGIIREAMGKFRGERRLFSPTFDGRWGGEDAFLGYAAWAYRVTMAYLPTGANAVRHMDHPRPPSEYNKDFSGRLDGEVREFRKYLAANPPSMDDITLK